MKERNAIQKPLKCTWTEQLYGPLQGAIMYLDGRDWWHQVLNLIFCTYHLSALVGDLTSDKLSEFEQAEMLINVIEEMSWKNV